VGGIGDDGLYAFAGYYYFFQNGDVSAVNFEHPPLGKYLIGLSIFLFRNENVINIIYFLFLLLGTYMISGILFAGRKTVAIASLFILSVDPLFLDHLIRSQLDLPFTLFFVWAVYFFLASFKKPSFLYVSFLFWGCAFSTRFFPFFVPLYILLFLLTYRNAKKNMTIFALSTMLVPIIYLISHLSYFFYHPSFIEFLRHKKWMLAWFSGSVKIVGNLVRNILTGYYSTPSGLTARNEHWIILQPVTLISGLFSPLLISAKKIESRFVAVYSICLSYLLYAIFLTDGAAKFIMPIYPILCILASHTIGLLYSIITGWKRKILRS
jgi:hypothetical protein